MRKDWKIGRLKDWKIERLEDWKIERLEDWKIIESKKENNRKKRNELVVIGERDEFFYRKRLYVIDVFLGKYVLQLIKNVKVP